MPGLSRRGPISQVIEINPNLLSLGQSMRMNLAMGSVKLGAGNLEVNSFQDQGTWNSDDQRYASILVGHQSAKRRFDMDKQAVLCQISELDFSDLFPIVLSCEFSLAVFYARAIVIRLVRQICLYHDSGESNSQLSSMFFKLLVESQDGLDPQVMIRLLSLCFRQGQGPLTHPERLFPSLLHVTRALSLFLILFRELWLEILLIPHL